MNESGWPRTPILDNLVHRGRAPNLRLKDRYRQILEELTPEAKPVVIMLIGSPGSGKTALVTELLATAHYSLSQLGLDENAISNRLAYFGFEDAMRLATAKGYPRSESEKAVATYVHYRQACEEFDNGIAARIRPGALLLAEAPGLVGRGSLSAESLGKHDGVYVEKAYDAYFVFVTADDSVADPSLFRRWRFLERPTERLEILKESGVEVVEDGGHDPRITGGDTLALERYFDSEHEYLFNLLAGEQGDSYFRLHITHPYVFRNPILKAMYLEELVFPWYASERLEVPADRFYIVRNRWVDKVILYQLYLDRYNALRV